jgi:hypothetical protein
MAEISTTKNATYDHLKGIFECHSNPPVGLLFAADCLPGSLPDALAYSKVARRDPVLSLQLCDLKRLFKADVAPILRLKVGQSRLTSSRLPLNNSLCVLH